MVQSAESAWRSPPRLSLRRWVFPADASTGLTPQRAAKDACGPKSGSTSPPTGPRCRPGSTGPTPARAGRRRRSCRSTPGQPGARTPPRPRFRTHLVPQREAPAALRTEGVERGERVGIARLVHRRPHPGRYRRGAARPRPPQRIPSAVAKARRLPRVMAERSPRAVSSPGMMVSMPATTAKEAIAEETVMRSS